MERSRVTRYVRIIVTALSLTACVLLTALWVRSYWTCDLVSRMDANSLVTTLGSNRETVYFVRLQLPGFRAAVRSAMRPRPQHGWRHSSSEANPVNNSFIWQFSEGITNVTLPLWLVVPILAAAGATPWIKWRFSLRTLLIATTLVAVGFGVVTGLR
jgi:hypothetical protein